MSTPDDLNTLLPDLEGPVAPNPEFAARLRNRFVSASGYQPTRQPRLVPAQTGNASPTPIRASRRRWLDMAAVAVLLLSMIGGIARVTTTSDTPTPAIQAPKTEQPVMIGPRGFASQAIPGPAPFASEYTLLWTASDAPETIPGFEVVVGQVLYRLTFVDKTRSGPYNLIAQDLYSGAVLWQREIVSLSSYAVTTVGVIAGLATGSVGTSSATQRTEVRLALLDLKTGAPIWQSEQAYRDRVEMNTGRVLVDNQTIIYSDNQGSISALALYSGAELWTYTYDRTLPVDIEPTFCYFPPDIQKPCGERSAIPIAIAIRRGTLYFSDMVTTRLTALNLNSGSEKWSTSIGEPETWNSVAFGDLVAVDDGVIIGYQDVVVPDVRVIGVMEKFSEAHGKSEWSTQRSIASSIVRSNTGSLFVALNDSDSDIAHCCDVVEISAASGQIVWRANLKYLAHVVGYLTDSNTVVLRSVDAPEQVLGLDATRHEIRWTYQFKSRGCYEPIFPLAEDGTMACTSPDAVISVYQPTSAAATPPASPVTSEQSIMANGSAAMDGTGPGLAPASGDYRLRWQDHASAFGYVAPFRDKIYQYIARVGPTNTGGIVAYDAQTGAEHWYQPVTSNFTFAVTSAGIIAGIPDSFDSEGSPAADAGLWDFHVVLLGLDTGQPIWRSAETYLLASQPFSMSAQIVGDTILFVDRQLTLVTLDLATGQERWRVESSELPAPDCICTVGGPAISGGIVYINNPVTGQIVAVSLSTGEQKWAVDDPAGPVVLSSGGTVISPSIVLAAVEQGVVVNTWWIPRDESHGYFGVLSAADGSPIWEWDSDKPVQAFARFGDALIVLTRDLGEHNWQVERVDIATGRVLAQSTSTAYSSALFVSSLPEANLVIIHTWAWNVLVGLDPVTLDVAWTRPAIEDCGIVFPVMPDGSLLCNTRSGLAVYEPVSVSATPGASPAAIQAQIENGDFLVTIKPEVIMREEPAADADVAEIHPEAGTKLQYMGRSKIDSAGTLWYMVRNTETARVGWIPATDLIPDK
jgi:outer membrane protein assembly factor BamB